MRIQLVCQDPRTKWLPFVPEADKKNKSPLAPSLSCASHVVNPHTHTGAGLPSSSHPDCIGVGIDSCSNFDGSLQIGSPRT